MNKLKNVIKKFQLPECFSEYRIISPKKIPIRTISRLKCFQCGLYSRAILCPPYLWQTYSQFKTFKSTKNFVQSFDKAIVLVWKNDGTKSWKINKEELSHIVFKKKKARELKGTEASQSREITKLMRVNYGILKRNGFNVFGLIQGHCDLCALKCPNRDNPPCKKKGMPSLESIGIDVYELLEKLKIDYQYPVIDYLTIVTMFLVRRK